MSIEEKIAFVEEHRDRFGFNRCCETARLSKGTWHYRKNRPLQNGRSQQDEELHEVIVDVIRDHPGYGRPRLTEEVSERLQSRVNHKRIGDRLQRWDLQLLRTVSSSPKSVIQRILDEAAGELNLVKGWDPGPFEMLSGDFTELRYAGGTRKAYLVGWVDPELRILPGWAVGKNANRWLALESWERVRSNFELLEQQLAGVVVHTDQDSVFKSYDWLRTVITEDWCVVSYSEDGARENPWIESVWSRFKDDNYSLLIEAPTLEEVIRIVDDRMGYYHERRRHSGTGNLPPLVHAQQEGIIRLGLSLK